MSEERGEGQKHQAAYTHITEQSLTQGCGSHTQTYRGSSLSEDIINMSTSPLSAPLVLNILSVTALFQWNRGTGEQRPLQMDNGTVFTSQLTVDITVHVQWQ